MLKIPVATESPQNKLEKISNNMTFLVKINMVVKPHIIKINGAE
jgi:hypothetical protein